MKNIFIGIDGGGTKTSVRVENAVGELLGQAKSGPANIRTSIPQAWHSILTGIETALAATSIRLDDRQYRFHIGLGLAGTEDHQAAQEFLGRPHPFTSLILDSDAYTACLAAHNGEDGTIIIIGTGVIGYSLYQQQRYTVAGWGFPYSDKGCGAWLGMEAIRLVFRYIDGQVADSSLIQAILARFNNEVNDIVSWSNVAGPAEFADIAPLVISQIEQQDVYAVGLIEEASREIELIAETLEKKLPANHTPLPCCLLGGIAPFIQPRIRTAVQSRLVTQQYDAAKGAIFMLKQQCGALDLVGCQT